MNRFLTSVHIKGLINNAIKPNRAYNSRAERFILVSSLWQTPPILNIFCIYIAFLVGHNKTRNNPTIIIQRTSSMSHLSVCNSHFSSSYVLSLVTCPLLEYHMSFLQIHVLSLNTICPFYRYMSSPGTLYFLSIDTCALLEHNMCSP